MSKPPSPAAKSGTLRMSVRNTGFLLDRLGQDCGDLQFLRELTQNSIEAITKCGGKGEIRWDLDSNLLNLEGKSKISITDNGIGMNAEEMQRYVNELSSSSAMLSMTGNYGVGAKIAAATRNHAGVVYISWKDGEGTMVHLFRDPATGEYGLKQFKLDDGTYSHFVPISDDLKPELIESHGTVVTLFGNSINANTMDAPKGASAPSRWIAKYLNSRYFEIPDGITIMAREGWDYPRSDGDRNKLRTIIGQKAFLTDHCSDHGSVSLTGATVHWWILEDSKALSQHSNYIESAGHVAALYQNELYELLTNKARNSRLQEFGIIFGCRLVVMYVEPEAKNITTTTARTLLLMNGEPLPWSDWASEFRDRMPERIRQFVEEQGSVAAGRDHSKSIKDRLKSVMALFHVTRYRPSSNGALDIDPDLLAQGGNPPPFTQSERSRGLTRNSSGGEGGSDGNAYALFQKKSNSKGNAADGESFPEVTWVSIEDGSRDRDCVAPVGSGEADV